MPPERRADIHLSLNVRGMKPSATVAINEHCNELLASGREIYKLGLGQSPFPVPEAVVQALRDSAHEKDYLPVKGLRELRHEVAAYHGRKHGIGGDADDVIIGPGSKELMFLLQLVFYGDILIPTPAWVSYAPQADVLGRKVRWLPTRPEDRWQLTADMLEEHCRDDPSRPRLLILNDPSNPTGGSLDGQRLEELAAVARRYGVLLLSDEIYAELRHDGRHGSIATRYPEGTIVSSGLSKWCGAGGWRLGTFMLPESLRWLLDALAAVASETYTSTCAPVQHAAITAFRGSPAIDRYLRDCRRLLRALGSWCAERLRGAGAQVHDPLGAFYLFPDFSPLSERLAARGVTTSDELCRRLLEDTGVAILPGSFFGRWSEELTARLAYVDFDGARALDELRQLGEDQELDESLLRELCPNVVQALERMCSWLATSA